MNIVRRDYQMLRRYVVMLRRYAVRLRRYVCCVDDILVWCTTHFA